MLIVKQAGTKGKGVFTDAEIFEEQWVLTFGGPIVHCRSAHSVRIGSGLHVEVEGTPKYVNHSCEPNCKVINDIMLMALRDIPVGGEITYDYSTTEEHIQSAMTCQCGSPRCRGKITGYCDIE